MRSSHKKEPLRISRERELVKVTRRLFDERGVQDARIEKIAREAGIARGLVYRHFSSKEELFVLTVTDYLEELHGAMKAEIARARTPLTRLDRCSETFARFCLEYPAFIDCALSLMRGPASGLQEQVSDSVWLRLGRGMARCIDQLAAVLRELEVEDPDFLANYLWTSALGAMHLARIRGGVKRAGPGVPILFDVDPEQVVSSCVRTARAAAEAGSS